MELFAQFAVVLIILTSSSMLLFRQWRVCLFMLALQYIGIFILISLSWSLEMAIVKLLTGWVAAAVLGFSMASITLSPQPSLKSANLQPILHSETLIYFSLVGLVLLVVFSVVPAFLSWEVGISPQQVYGGFALMVISALHLTLTQHPFRLFLGLLSFLSGVEVIYAAIEGSVLVAALFTVIQLSLALAGSYLIVGYPLQES